MSSKTRIVVLKMKELIYAGIFVGLAIIMIILLILMFSNKKSDNRLTGRYTSGVYTASITLSGQDVDVEVAVDRDHINSIRFVNLSEDIATMFPLMQTSLENITSQIIKNQSLENIHYQSDAKYTSIVILKAIQKALNLAQGKAEEDNVSSTKQPMTLEVNPYRS